MDRFPPPDDVPAARAESAADKRQRIAREATMLAEARAEIAAGLVVESTEVDAWIDSIGTDHELPPPHARR